MVSRKGVTQFRKGLVGCCLGWTAVLSIASQGADLPAQGDPPERARVVMAENVRATVAFEAQPKIVETLVDRGILKLTGKADLKQAWGVFVSPKDVVGIKVYSGPGANSGTRPAVVVGIIEGLLKAGLEPSHIIIWDKRLLDLRLAGYDELARRYGVRLEGASDAGYDENVFYDNSVLGSLVAGDLDFDRNGKTTGRNSYLSKLLTQTITKIINVTPLLNHNYAGVCGNLYSLAMGSVDNTLRFEASPERLATAVPEIYAKPALSDHVVLNITDALIGQYQGEQMSLLHYATAVNQIWLSKDPVALDVLAIQQLDRERQERKIDPGNDNPDLYRNASYYLELGVGDPAKIRIEWAK
ncbi:MAG: DUF362 domain-containing protein [Verrucomicrobiota bacterium]